MDVFIVSYDCYAFMYIQSHYYVYPIAHLCISYRAIFLHYRVSSLYFIALYYRILSYLYYRTVSFHNFKSQNIKLSVSNPKNKHVVDLSVLSQISNCQSLSRKNKHEILKTDRDNSSNDGGDPGWLRTDLRKLYACIYRRVYIDMYIDMCMYMYIYICMCICTCIYIYIYTFWAPYFTDRIILLLSYPIATGQEIKLIVNVIQYSNKILYYILDNIS